jgi:hypothetical protein
MIVARRRLFAVVVAAAAAWLAAAPALPQAPAPGAVGNAASITLHSGPHKGRYAFAPSEACVLAAFNKQPMGLSIVMGSRESSLSIEVPNLDEKHASEIQIVFVVAELNPGTAKGMSSVTYEIDTRPDAVLKPHQRAERANRGITGKATTTLMTQGDATLLTFTGETAKGIRIDGEVTCRRVGAG